MTRGYGTQLGRKSISEYTTGVHAVCTYVDVVRTRSNNSIYFVLMFVRYLGTLLRQQRAQNLQRRFTM